MVRNKVLICWLVVLSLLLGMGSSVFAHTVIDLSVGHSIAHVTDVTLTDHDTAKNSTHISCQKNCQDHHTCCGLTARNHPQLVSTNMVFPRRLISSQLVEEQLDVEVPPPKKS